MIDRALLARYLRQRAELGEREMMLEDMTARELLRALASGPGSAPGPASAEGASARGREGGTGAIRVSPARAASAAEAASPPVTAAGSGTLDASARSRLIREALGGGVPTAAGKYGYAPQPAPPTSPAQPAVAPGPEQPVPPARPPAIPPSAGSRPNPSPVASALQVLSMEVAACTACRLASAGRRQTVFGRGDPGAELVVVGEAPGQEEDRTGLPFVGPAGKLLDLLLLSVGFPRDSVYICNTLKCRPPQNRNPLPDELAACSRFLKAQLAEIQPKVVLAVGKFAAQSLLGSDASMSQLRGRTYRYEGVPLIVSYHPAYLLRTGSATRSAWEDFQLARKVFDEQA